MGKIVVVGSSNTDMVVKTPRFPEPGETILGGDFFMFPGGKGANQAVAAARVGGEVSFICSLGDDIFGKNSLDGYTKEKINTSSVLVTANTPSGVALITVNASGENEIVVASGANALLSEEHLESASGMLNQATMVLTQLETPMATVEFLAQRCRETGIPLIINPAPAQKLTDETLKGLYLITPNETETRILTGIDPSEEGGAEKASAYLLEKGVQNVIITLGKRGAYFHNAEKQFLSKPPVVMAVDTTAAGDVFNGVLTVCLSQNKSWEESIAFANKAAALSVTRMGAQASAPYLDEIN
ncbi:ribokinase [Poritiphilus flavus]|uniref:Ribokinase n=1 Tax=Poritiphilus flavus TaxID=2697053 RepID=A0A6L9E8A4_9FLAO|nr:ribokinase [Poritiphilus flavus]NAS10689.1 ribokinase [Poritiphilus flavus]